MAREPELQQHNPPGGLPGQSPVPTGCEARQRRPIPPATLVETPSDFRHPRGTFASFGLVTRSLRTRDQLKVDGSVTTSLLEMQKVKALLESIEDQQVGLAIQRSP
jgi:hypothetical protein